VSKKLSLSAAISAAFVIVLTTASGLVSAGGVKVVSDKTVTGFKFPESAAYDANAKVLYVSEFGSALKPTQKDGAGRISKVALDGTVLEQTFLPAAGQTLDKPKGVWVAGDRLWTTDIDSAWVFDTKTKKGKKVDLPGIKFANDPTVVGNTLYVSDNRGDQLYSVEPADFLNAAGDPKVTLVWSGKSINPNGVYPAADGSLLMVGFGAAETPRGIHAMTPSGETKALSEGIGRLDGVYEMSDGSLLVTDWNSGSLFQWSAKSGITTLASGFKGPADFAVAPNSDGLLVVVPDLVKSELRLIQLGK
jgi:sugar lactone lactonase YvrE